MSGKKLRPGEIVTAQAVRIENYGVFFDYDNGTNILVLITEMTQGVFGHPSEVISLGNEAKLKILRYNEENDGYAATMLIEE